MRGAWAATGLGAVLFGVLLAIYLNTGRSAFRSAAADLPWWMFAAVVLQLVYQYGSSSLRALGRIPAASAAQAVQALVGGGLGIALVAPLGMHGMLWAWLLGGVLAWVVLRRAGPEVPWIPADAGRGLALMRSGLPLFATFLCTLVLRSVDRLALLRFSGTEALGYYGLAAIAASTVLHVPEAAAYVLLPRLAAAAAGARDRDRTRDETVRAHRALVVLLPPVAALGVLFTEPIVARFLPEYAQALPPLRVLVAGSLFLAAANLPVYTLLAERDVESLVEYGLGGTLGAAIIVFGIAARDPSPASVALAAALGYVLFSVSVTAPVFGRWSGGSWRGRVFLMAASFLPAFWTGALLQMLSHLGDGSRVEIFLLRVLAFGVAYMPVLWLFGRGIGFRSLWRERFNQRT
jgi:O-antigen/teichoic acid export membrane protein